VLWPDGTTRWIEARAVVIKDTAGRPLRMLGANVDVTERHEAEDALRRSEARVDAERRLLDAVLDAAPAGILVADVHRRLLRINRASERLWGPARLLEDIDEYRAWRGWWAEGTEHAGRSVEPHEWAMSRALRGETVREDLVDIQP